MFVYSFYYFLKLKDFAETMHLFFPKTNDQNVGKHKFEPELKMEVDQTYLDICLRYRNGNSFRKIGTFYNNLEAESVKKRLKKAQLVSHMIPRSFTFSNVPLTTVTFDPYTVAPFQEAPAPETLFKEENLQKVYAWATGTSYSELGFDHPMKFNRFLRTNVKRILETHLKL